MWRFSFSCRLSFLNSLLKRRRRWQENDKFAYSTMKNNNFSRFECDFFILVHFAAVLVFFHDVKWSVSQLKCTTWAHDDNIFNFFLLSPNRWYQFDSRILSLSTIMSQLLQVIMLAKCIPLSRASFLIIKVKFTLFCHFRLKYTIISTDLYLYRPCHNWNKPTIMKRVVLLFLISCFYLLDFGHRALLHFDVPQIQRQLRIYFLK